MTSLTDHIIDLITILIVVVLAIAIVGATVGMVQDLRKWCRKRREARHAAAVASRRWWL